MKRAPAPRLTRAQAASRLDVSISTVRRYEREWLHPRVDEDDVCWFDEKEVAGPCAVERLECIVEGLAAIPEAR